MAALLGVTAVYLICTGWILKEPQSGGRAAWAAVLLPALAFRLSVWTVEPGFSDDVNRYRWEARAQWAGLNPYETAPVDPRAATLRDAAYSRVPGVDFRAVYGPFTELVLKAAYGAASRLGAGDPWREAFWMKLPAALFELGTLAGVAAVSASPALCALYAWSPLIVFEFWANGHNDPIALCPLIWALWAAMRARRRLGFLLLGLAAAAKIWPLLLLPAFIERRHWRAAAFAVPPIALCLIPFGAGLIGNAPFASGFLGGWRNNATFFELLLWLTGDLYRAKYAAFAILGGLSAAMHFSRAPLPRRALTLIVGMLLISANCHPWYLSWFLVLLPLEPSAALLLWSALMPLSYQVLIGWEVLGVWEPSHGWLALAPALALYLGTLYWRHYGIPWRTDPRDRAVVHRARADPGRVHGGPE